MSSKEEIKAFIVETANAHFKEHNVKASLDAKTWGKWTRYVEEPCRSLSALTDTVAKKFGVPSPKTLETFATLDDAVEYVSTHQTNA